MARGLSRTPDDRALLDWADRVLFIIEGYLGSEWLVRSIPLFFPSVTMPKQIVNNVPGGVPPLGSYSQVAIFNGTAYISGSIGCDRELVIVGGVQSQIRHALDNMKALVEGAGSDLEHVLKVTVYLTNLERDIVVFDDIYLEYFADTGGFPARTCVGVASLPLGVFVQIDCIAQVPTRCDH